MVKLINATFGTDMWVAEERLEEYLAAGHKPAADAHRSEKPKMVPNVDEVEDDEPRPRGRRKKE